MLVVLGIYGTNIFEWVTAIMNPHQEPCNPVNVTLDEIRGPSYPAQSLNDSRYWTGPQGGAGIPSCDTVTIADYRSNGTISLDFRGYVYWDDDHWEIHPATAWKPSTTAKWASASVESTSGPAESTYVLERPWGRVAAFWDALIFVPNAVRISAARTTSDSATRSSGT